MILLLFSIGFERICLESRIKQYGDEVNKMELKYTKLQSAYDKLTDYIANLEEDAPKKNKR
ncbi:hypothetical protein GF336_02925 [Candidatus Woesearchaeota archaeon]|nr:hypothetical protein [Candidatus Woesearchaeota archaeon]